ncbi:MAG: 5-oxoprolinase subunit PxpA [Balneola sp.]
MKTSIDLNCDLGEWRSDDGPDLDKAIMPYISSCNIACGGHIGNEISMRWTVILAKKNNVKVGAHPSYPDRRGFGRRQIEMDKEDLKNSLKDQILSLKEIAEAEGIKLHHVKPHGALYNASSKHREIANAVAESIKELGLDVLVYGQSGSEFEKAVKENGLEFCAEVFADRAYEEDLRLRSRDLEGAVLRKKEDVLTQIFEMTVEEKVTSYSGKQFSIEAETICLHSDTKGSQELAKNIYQFLKNHGIKVIAA